jgi:hypothetical protein
MKHGFRGLMVAVALVAAGATSSQAAGTSCGFATPMVADGQSRTGFISAGASDHFWSYYGVANRSYAVEITGFGYGFGDFGVDFALCDPAALPAGWLFTDRTLNEPKMDQNATTNGRRRVVKAPTQFGNGWTSFQLTNSNAAGRSYEIRVVDTTMFSAAWSTNPGYNTYFSFYNNTNQTISGTIVLTTTAGAAGGTATLSIPPGRTVPTNTVALGTPASSTGTALFFHDGAPGSIQAESGIANFTFTPPYIQYVTFKARDYQR